MRSDYLFFALWMAFVIGIQLLNKRKRRQQRPRMIKPLPTLKKKPAQPQPGSFVCREAQEPEERPGTVVEPTVKPVHSDLVEEIRDLKPTVAPQVVEHSRKQTAAGPVHPALAGNLREGMVWTMILGRPRCRQSWMQERNRRV